MTQEKRTTSKRDRRWLTRTLTASAALVLVIASGIDRAGSDPGKTGSSHRDPIAEATAVQHKLIEFYNARKWDELGALYLEDAIAVPPNHEPIRGRAAIVEYWRSVRDALGEGECGEPLEGTVSGNLVALVSRSCSGYSGRLGVTAHELYERRADGSLRLKFDMFGLR
jgi:ketosteroid isomerase-like protein